MADNGLSTIVQLIIDKAKARTDLQRELKELQREAQIETDVKVNLSDVKQARKEIQQANREQQAGTRENIKLRAQELANARMIAKETKTATDLEIANRQRATKLTVQASKEELANARATANARSAQTTQELSERKNANAILKQDIADRKTALALQKLQTQEERAKNQETAKADKIQHLSDSGQYQAQYDTLIAKTNQWTNKQGEARIATTTLKQSLDELNQASLSYANNNSVENAQKLSTALEKYDTEAKKVTNEVRTMNATMAKDSAIQKLNQQITEFMDKNPKAVKAFGTDLKNMLSQSQVGANLTNKELDELTASFVRLKNEAGSSGKLGNTFFGTMKENIKSFVPWTTGTGLIMGLANSVRGAISNVYELDAAITNLDMATNASNASEQQLDSYIDTYIKLGDELSATVTDVTVSATEWLKQGKSIAETETLVRDSMILSKVGKLESAQATEYLTSAMKGYKVATEDALGIVDKLSAVDMASATDVGGLAEAMSGVAASANLAGVSMDKLLGYAASIGEVTQEGMSHIGTMLNATFSRMGNIKLARLKDYQNNGEDLSNVETVLRGVGIALRDSQNSFRDFDDVLDETANNWDSYSEVQQRAIASAFSGTHYLNEFIVLMENYDKALNYTDISMNSSGEAMQKYEAYQESLAGKSERLKNALIALSDAFVESEFLGGLTDFATGAVNAVTKLIDKFGVLSTAGIGLGAVLGAKNVGRAKCSPSHRILFTHMPTLI